MALDKRLIVLNTLVKAWQNAGEDVYTFTQALREFEVKLLKARYRDKVLQAPDMEQGEYFITAILPWFHDPEKIAVYRLIHGEVYIRDDNGDVRRLDSQDINPTELLWLYDSACDWEEVKE
jgi:hypothetical protein